MRTRFALGEDRGGQLVGDVERVVADQRQVRGVLAEEAEGGEVADEDRVRVARRGSA